jgi:hypothetical protein
MGLDISPVRCDDHEAGMRAVILQPFDELVVGFGFGVVAIISGLPLKADVSEPCRYSGQRKEDFDGYLRGIG